LGFYWLSTEKSRSNETNGVASTTGFAEASSRTGRRGKAPGEVLPAALHIRGETFSATRHVVEPKLHLTATADQTPSAGRLVPAGKPTLFQRKKEKDSLHENTRRHRGDELGFQSPRRRSLYAAASSPPGDPPPPPPKLRRPPPRSKRRPPSCTGAHRRSSADPSPAPASSEEVAVLGEMRAAEAGGSSRRRRRSPAAPLAGGSAGARRGPDCFSVFFLRTRWLFCFLLRDLIAFYIFRAGLQSYDLRIEERKGQI
jgi:hypothetical protein